MHTASHATAQLATTEAFDKQPVVYCVLHLKLLDLLLRFGSVNRLVIRIGTGGGGGSISTTGGNDTTSSDHVTAGPSSRDL
ncbi:hypothetical protein TYRP_008887 [Tyrophagus putrescentiae]|nr:hypothetical protein TYRP_008887 [Tyrophagus putrescentiae]